MERLWALDQSILRTVNVDWHRPWLDPVFWVISSTGLGYVQVLIILALVRWRKFLKRGGLDWSAWQPFAGPMLLSWAAVGMLNSYAKHAVPRERPSNLAWTLPQEGFYYNSFSSGHTATSFALALSVLFATRGRHWVGWVLLLWATLVGFSRVYRGVHWPSDVLAGLGTALFGCSLIAIVLAPNQAREAPTPQVSEEPEIAA